MATAEAASQDTDHSLVAPLSILVGLATLTGIGVITLMDDGDFSYEAWKRTLLNEASSDVLVGIGGGGNCNFKDYQREQDEIADIREDIAVINRQLTETSNLEEIERLTGNKNYLSAYLQHLLNTHGHCPPTGQH
jgi:hypothetical protein